MQIHMEGLAARLATRDCGRGGKEGWSAVERRSGRIESSSMAHFVDDDTTTATRATANFNRG
jgi:hypothetical protein